MTKAKNKLEHNARNLTNVAMGNKLIEMYDIFSDPYGIYLYQPKGYFTFKHSEELLRRDITDHLKEQNFETRTVTEILSYIKYSTFSVNNSKPLNKLCLENGTLNLDTMKLEKHSPINKLKYILPVKYDMDVNTDAWDYYIDSLVSNPWNKTLQEAIGNIFTPHYITKKMLYLFGGHDSGKSTFFNIIQSFLGRNNYSTVGLHEASKLFMNYDMIGKLANFGSDIDYKLPLQNYSVLKQLTGSDEFQVRQLYQNAVTFLNTNKMFFCGNDIPMIDKAKADSAFYIRWLMIECPHTFTTKDPQFISKYTTSKMKSAILKWTLNGLQRLRKNHWVFTNEQSKERICEMFNNAIYALNTFDEWLLDQVTASPNEFLSIQELYEDCKGWHEKRKLTYPATVESFGKLMWKQTYFKLKEYNPSTSNGQIKAYKGITWRGKPTLEF